MNADRALVSSAFRTFLSDAPGHAAAWMGAVEGLSHASALDPKTRALTYLSVLAALGLTSGIPFHATQAITAGATKSEIISAILVGLPAAGQVVLQSLPPAIEAITPASDHAAG
jgi:alkylhydroperoxidase/carboxymuconolactone decarboxylase family protein YurZ